MNNDKGELTKKAELLEIEFLQEMGVDTLGKYPDVEKHIDKIEDSDLKITLLSCIQDMESDLNV